MNYLFTGRCNNCTQFGPQDYGYALDLNCSNDGNCNGYISFGNKKMICNNSSSITNCLQSPQDAFLNGQIATNPSFLISSSEIIQLLRNTSKPCLSTNCLPFSDTLMTNDILNDTCYNSQQANFFKLLSQSPNHDPCGVQISFSSPPTGELFDDYCSYMCPSKLIQQNLVSNNTLSSSELCDQTYFNLCTLSNCPIDNACTTNWNNFTNNLPDQLPIVYRK